MDSRVIQLYSSFLTLFLALQYHFLKITEDRPKLMDMYQDLLIPAQLRETDLMKDSDYLEYQLTELGELALELEENIDRAIIEILESPSDQSESWREEFENLLREVRDLQADLIPAIRSRSSTWHSLWRSLFDGKGRLPSWTRSLPNIPSTLFDPEFGFDPLTKWQSMNESITFKKKSKEIFIDHIISDLETGFRRILKEGLQRGTPLENRRVGSNTLRSLHSTNLCPAPADSRHVPRVAPTPAPTHPTPLKVHSNPLGSLHSTITDNKTPVQQNQPSSNEPRLSPPQGLQRGTPLENRRVGSNTLRSHQSTCDTELIHPETSAQPEKKSL